MTKSTDITSDGSRISRQQVVTALGPFLGLALVFAFFAIDPDVRPYFLQSSNMAVIATQTAIVALAALGMTLIIISGGIDLSVGSLIALSGVVVAILLSTWQSPPTLSGQRFFLIQWHFIHLTGNVVVLLAIGATVLIGAIVGCVNGSVIAGLKVTPFIVTLGTLGIVRGIAKWVAHNNAIDTPPSLLDNMLTPGSHTMLGLPAGVWLTIGLAVVTSALLKYTVFGRHILAIGSNEAASRLSGLRVDALKIAIYSLAGIFFGLAGVLQSSRLHLGDPTVAQGEELDVIASVVIGGGSLSGGEGSVLGSLIGALIMGVLRNGAQLKGWPDYVQQIIIGAVIVGAVALDRLRHRKRAI